MFCAIILFRCSAWWAPGVPGSSNRTQKANPPPLCGSQYFPEKTRCRSYCWTSFQHNSEDSSVDTKGRMCERVHVACVSVRLVAVYWGGTGRNLGVCSCHDEMSTFMTRCLRSGTCELFLLQTFTLDICTFLLHTQALRGGTGEPLNESWR